MVLVLCLCSDALLWLKCSASYDSEDERLRGDEEREAELMEELAMAQAMEPKNDVSWGRERWPISC